MLKCYKFETATMQQRAGIKLHYDNNMCTKEYNIMIRVTDNLK